MPQRNRLVLIVTYILATVQFAWCYLWLTRPYVNTALYEQGLERMPFQGRVLMMWPMRWAHNSVLLHRLSEHFAASHFWFPRPVQPEVLVQAAVNVLCLLVAGYLTTRLYQASSSQQLLTPFIYPLLLVACATTYILHTVQNFRFIYDLPSLACFATAMYLLRFQRHWAWFVALFLVASVNRETTLLLLPLFAISGAIEHGRLRWQRLFRLRTVAVILPLACAWIAWQIFIRDYFGHNRSEFYPRLDWNVKSLLVPQAWPQLLSACGYLLLFVVVMRKRIVDPEMRAWLWVLPIWCVFMFSFGILIETRIFGELIPFVVSTTALIVEELLVARMVGLRAEPRGGSRIPALPVSKAA